MTSPRRKAVGEAASGPNPETRWRQLLAEDPDQGWRAFIDAQTPGLLGLIARAGITDRDEAMEIYVRVCERLAAHDCAALRRHDPSLGSLDAWLAVVVKRAVVDWVRSRVGRRRLFASVRHLDRFDQRLFELFYWEGRRPTEAAEVMRVERREDVSLTRVFAALERIDGALSARQRGELFSALTRSRAALPLGGTGDVDAGGGVPAIDPPTADPDPEALLGAQEREGQLARALAGLPVEDAVIVSLKFVEGLTREQIRRFLRLPELTEHRIRTIVATLRARLSAAEPGKVQDV